VTSTDVPPRRYLDAAAGEPLSPVARAALTAAIDDGWADPRRLYAEGRRAGLLLDAARAAVATAIGAQPDEVVFTSSGTSARHSAVLGALAGPPGEPPGTAVVSAVEHSGVLAAAAHGAGAVEAVPVDRLGRVDLASFAAAVAAPGVRVAALQSANGEVGTRQPVEQALAACRDAGVPLVVDAAHSLGRSPLPPASDILTADASLWGGPPGVGVLAVRRGTRWRPAGPETEAGDDAALPLVLSAALALEDALAGATAESARLHELVARVRAEVPLRVPDCEVVGDPDDRLPHLVTFSCLYVDGEALVTELDRLGWAVGSGSACTASTLRPSHVLAAMGVLTHGNVRVSLPRGTSSGTVEALLEDLPRAVAGVRTRLGVAGL
jgi:cysteine desulfurase